MGWRDKAEQLKAKAVDGLQRVAESDEAQHLKEAALERLEKVKQSDAIKDLDVESLKQAAIDSSGTKNRKGKVKRLRTIKAVVNPVGTTASVAKGVARDVIRQRRSREAISPTDTNPPIQNNVTQAEGREFQWFDDEEVKPPDSPPSPQP